MIKFTEITDKLKYPLKIKARLSTLHSDVITYVCDHFDNTYVYKNKVVGVLNTLSYVILTGDHLSSAWSRSDPLNNIVLIEDNRCKEVLKDLYLSSKNIEWNLSTTSNVSVSDIASTQPVVPQSDTSVTSKPILNSSNVDAHIKMVTISPTPKEDLYIRPPVVPRLDTAHPWYSNVADNTHYVIYPSEPRIPTKQNEISVTTDINQMTSVELMKLYPNRYIRTRASIMYERLPGVPYDDDLGLLIPIEGFTYEQIRDNIVKYPHIFRLTKLVDDRIVNFYTTIEIDGQLCNIAEIWDTLPESDLIPRNSEFVKEYVVRRYLLERDILGVQHKYMMYGSLDPFLTLFTTSDEYIRLGYTNVLDIAKMCVNSRVSYKRTRNPILRRFNYV